MARLQRQFVDHFDRLFAPREVFLRSDGRVKFIRLSRRQQLTGAVAAGGVAGWGVLATAGLAAVLLLYAQQQSRLRDAGAELQEAAARLRAAQHAYADLREQVAGAGSQLTAMTQSLWYHQQLLLDIAGADSGDLHLVPAAAGDGADRAKAVLAQAAANLNAIAAGAETLGGSASAIAERVAASDEARERAERALREAAASLDAEKDRSALFAADVASLRAQIARLELASDDDAAARTALRSRLADLTDRLAAATAENRQLAQAVTGMQKTAAVVADDRNALRAARDDLSSQIAFLESRMSAVQSTQQSIVKKLAERTRLTVAEVEKTVQMTGLDVDSLLAAAAGKFGGAGGPFVPVARAVRSVEERLLLASIQNLDGEVGRWERLQVILRNLPLAAPLDNYALMSGYGDRADPLNGRRAFHAGIDLKNELGTPVLATAPGKVVYAAWMGDYGRVVEIDHGLGIHTRYAHLKSIDVKVGDEVEFRQEIGKVGSSGRSTGPHLHYEVQVNGKPHDPMNFMEAGKYVFKG